VLCNREFLFTDYHGRPVRLVLYRSLVVCNTRTYIITFAGIAQSVRWLQFGRPAKDVLFAVTRSCVPMGGMAPSRSFFAFILSVQGDEVLGQVGTFLLLNGYASAVTWPETVFRVSEGS
jgi:hypothetical protein